MNRLKHIRARSLLWWHARQARRRSNHLRRTLQLLNPAIRRYSDDSLAWLEFQGERFYFEGSDNVTTVTTYQPKEHTRRLITTRYRQT